MSDEAAGLEAEAVSAFMDGEGDCPERLVGDAAAHRRWQSYHLIRQVLRDSRPVALPANFADRVMAALPEGEVVDWPGPRRRWQWAVGVGVAAAAALAAVLLIDGVLPERGERMQGALLAGNTAPLSAAPALRPAALDGRPAPVAEDDPLDAYLLEHLQRSTPYRLPGVSPYVRLAGDGAGPR
ncbi:MAG: hypothetical protein KatS3mg121_0837 [Gammaproteobacteria bacterium]|nr:MAG: hypothetical protein KatS3mg121_0837 [Gammaproteobacteria bacterium]